MTLLPVHLRIMRWLDQNNVVTLRDIQHLAQATDVSAIINELTDLRFIRVQRRNEYVRA